MWRKSVSIVGLILNVIAIIVVLASQALYSAAIDSALSTNDPSQVVPQSENDSRSNNAATSSNSESFEDLALGTAVQLNNGITVSVDS
ncbi:hypothetical protein [Adlercreutzia sp. ZJ154]|uniref:hypothetical protein n=1 Tax=Adlercreutzia sp. ZJ154 TaxID=2709790 RepID=UPI0013EA9C84|nr:hypothetical protein [Adlercreutzia sp. ZJ154]